MGAGVATSPHLSQTGAPPGRGPPPWAAGSVPRRGLVPSPWVPSGPRGPGRFPWEAIGPKPDRSRWARIEASHDPFPGFGSQSGQAPLGLPADPRPKPEGRPSGRLRTEIRRLPAGTASRRFPTTSRLRSAFARGASALPGRFPKSRPASARAYAGVASSAAPLVRPGSSPWGSGAVRHPLRDLPGIGPFPVRRLSGHDPKLSRTPDSRQRNPPVDNEDIGSKSGRGGGRKGDTPFFAKRQKPDIHNARAATPRACDIVKQPGWIRVSAATWKIEFAKFD
jgi:hypothetical protein